MQVTLIVALIGGVGTWLPSLAWSLLPRPGISWQGTFGAIGGVAAAWLLHAHHPDDGAVA